MKDRNGPRTFGDLGMSCTVAGQLIKDATDLSVGALPKASGEAQQKLMLVSLIMAAVSFAVTCKVPFSHFKLLVEAAWTLCEGQQKLKNKN